MLKSAYDAYSEADFGQLSDIDACALYIEDEKGNRVWEERGVYEAV